MLGDHCTERVVVEVVRTEALGAGAGAGVVEAAAVVAAAAVSDAADLHTAVVVHTAAASESGVAIRRWKKRQKKGKTHCQAIRSSEVSH